MTTNQRSAESNADAIGLHTYAEKGERGKRIHSAIVNYNKMTRVLEERIALRSSQGKSLVSYSPYKGQGRILLALSQEDKLSQADLARKLEIRPQTLSTALKKLDAAGLITRTADPLDARVFLVQLTKKGMEYNRALKKEERYSGSMFEALDDDELELFARACQKLSDHLNAEIEASKASMAFIAD